ncbi:MAG: phosphatidate cytidylyltransferase [Candidatus Hodarchaeota archaeon]
MLYLPTSLIFFGYTIITFVYVIKNKKEKIENHLFINELLIVALLLIAGILFPFMFQFHSPDLSSDSLNFMWLVTSTIFLVELGILFAILIHNTLISKKNPNIMEERDYSKYCEEFNKNWVDDLKSELGRKFLHLFTTFIIYFFWTLGVFLEDLEILNKWGLDNYSFSYWLIITIGFGFVIMFQIADLARLNRFYMIPNWARRWYLDMKQNELYTFIASTPLVLSFTPFIFTPFPIFASVALITTGADAAACIIGKKYGKHSLRKNSNKTIEGFIAGGFTTFLIVMIVPIIYHVWMPVCIIKIILMAFVATLLFLIVDLCAKNISDNILNPFLTGLGMWLIFIF